MVAHFEQQGHRGLRHRHGAVGRYVGYCDASLGRGLHVDEVVAGGESSDVSERRHRVEFRRADAQSVDEHCVGSPGMLGQLFAFGGVESREITQLRYRLPVEVAGVDAVRVESHDLHICVMI